MSLSAVDRQRLEWRANQNALVDRALAELDRLQATADRLTAALGEAEGDIANWKRIFESASVRLSDPRRPLFVPGDFVAHSGATLHWKVECDALTPDDWRGLALLAVEHLPAFGSVYGVPRGGTPFAEALAEHVTEGPVLIADDVCTTGASLEGAREGLMDTSPVFAPAPIGVVAFARGPVPSWVTPLFATPTVLKLQTLKFEADAATGRAVGRRLRDGWYGPRQAANDKWYWQPLTVRSPELATPAEAAWLASLNALDAEEGT